MAKNKTPKISPSKGKIQHDRDKIREQFLQSPFMDWTRFAEEQGWDALLTRRELPVKTWQEEKRKIISEKQTDILSGLIFERRFKWTHQIIETLDGYPRSIDMAKQIADAKMAQIAEMYKDYTVFRDTEEYREQVKKGKRPHHPFEKVSLTEVSMLMKGMKDITEAKLKALMLDKWAITRLDIPEAELEAANAPEGAVASHRITIEGHGEVKPEAFQGWFDQWIDRPTLPPAPPPKKDVK